MIEIVVDELLRIWKEPDVACFKLQRCGGNAVTFHAGMCEQEFLYLKERKKTERSCDEREEASLITDV